MKKKILVIADSMAMPRLEVAYEDTWIYLLANNLKEVVIVDRCMRGSTSNRLNSEGGGYKGIRMGADLLEHYSPDIVITQLGIVDCAPRLANPNSIIVKLINRSPSSISDNYYRIKKKYCKRSSKNAYVSLAQFHDNCEEYALRCEKNDTKLIMIKISSFTNEGFGKNPEIVYSINSYNDILESIAKKHDHVTVVEGFSDKEIEKYAIDEYHYNKEGHLEVFERIRECLKSIKENILR